MSSSDRERDHNRRLLFSNPVRLMARPFRVYRELASLDDAPSVAVGGLRFMFVMGCLVALTATGRFAPFELVSAMISFAWLPIVYALGLAVTLRVFLRDVKFAKAFGLYLEGVGPWSLVLLLLAGSMLFLPQPARPTFMLLPVLVVGGTLWSVLLTFALFRSALALGRARAALATLTFYVTILALVLSYFLAIGQLWPILPW